jgi:serine/threonine protein kinase
MILYQTCLALDYLHCNKIAHCDIKMENILFSTESSVKVVDFGGARTFRRKSDLLRDTIGTKFYRPREWFQNGGLVDSTVK